MITQWVMMGSRVGRISMIHQVGVTVEWLGEHLGETQFFYYSSLESRMLRLIPAEGIRPQR